MVKIDADTFLERVYSCSDVKKDADLCVLLGKRQSTVSSWRRTKSIPYGRCYEIAKLLDLDLDKLLESNLVPKGADTIEIAYYKNTPVSAGGGAFALSEQPAETLKWGAKEFKKFIGNKAKTKDYMLFPVLGDSMAPTLTGGDNVVTNPQTEYTGDGIYVVRYDDNMYIKRIMKTRENYILQSDNPQYPPIQVGETDDFKIIAKALWRWGEI